jgi:hypothetical protein
MALLAKLFSPPTLLGDSETHLLEAISGEVRTFQHRRTAPHDDMAAALSTARSEAPVQDGRNGSIAKRASTVELHGGVQSGM